MLDWCTTRALERERESKFFFPVRRRAGRREETPLFWGKDTCASEIKKKKKSKKKKEKLVFRVFWLFFFWFLFVFGLLSPLFVSVFFSLIKNKKRERERERERLSLLLSLSLCRCRRRRLLLSERGGGGRRASVFKGRERRENTWSVKSFLAFNWNFWYASSWKKRGFFLDICVRYIIHARLIKNLFLRRRTI